MILHWVYGIPGAAPKNNGSLTLKLVQDVPAYYSGANAVLNSTECDVQEKEFTISYRPDCSVGYWDGLLGLTVCEFVTGFFHMLYLLELYLPQFWDKSVFKFWVSESICCAGSSTALPLPPSALRRCSVVAREVCLCLLRCGLRCQPHSL